MYIFKVKNINFSAIFIHFHTVNEHLDQTHLTNLPCAMASIMNDH